MKIAQVACVYSPYKSGLGNTARFFARASRDYGHESYVFTPDYGEVEADAEDEEGVRVRRIKPIFKHGKGAFMPSLFFYLKNLDIIHLHYPFFGGAEVVWFRRMIGRQEAKLAIHYHMDVPGRGAAFKFLSGPSEIIKNSLFKLTDVVTCASLDYVKESSISRIFEKYRFKFNELPFAVDENFFSPGPSDKKEKNLVFIGGLDKAHYFKGLDVLLAAFSESALPGRKLVIIGDGDRRKFYEKEIYRLNIAEQVIFMGAVNDKIKAEILRKSGVLVLPSTGRNEAFGLVLLEALASGVPVIASDLPGVRSVFTNRVQGLLVKPGDADDLKKKIEYLLNNEDERAVMGMKARQLVMEKYTAKQAKENLNQFYLKLSQK